MKEPSKLKRKKINKIELSNIKNIPHIELIGDPITNFYQLGLKDSKQAKILYTAIGDLFRLPSTILNENIKSLITKSMPLILKKNSFLSNYFTSYCDGLNIDQDQVFYALILPELLSMLKKWLPNLAIPMIGCSSFFGIDSKTKDSFHLRTLDFPLNQLIDVSERTISYNLNHLKRVFTYSFSGLPYPSLTSINEDGLTLALHQKYTDVFEKKGRPIFEIAFSVLSTCKNTTEALNYLKKSTSITTWGMYLSDINQNILEVDIAGKDVLFNKYQLSEKNKFFYFNNLPLNKKQTDNPLPISMTEFNQQRTIQANALIKKIEKRKSFTEIDALKTFSQRHSDKTFKITPHTPGSINIATFCPQKFSSMAVCGDSPRVYINGIKNYQNIFTNLKETLLPQKMNEKNYKYNRGINYAMRAELAFDKRNIHEGFHYLQLSQDILTNLPEQNVVQFYYIFYAFLFISDFKLLEQYYLQLTTLKNTLTSNLNNHLCLLLFRLERLLEKEISIHSKNFDNLIFKSYFNQEKKIPIKIVHQLLKYTSKPRLEIFDIIYPHLKTAL